MKIVLIGTENSKRTTYFIEAAKGYGVIPKFIDFSEIEISKLNNTIIKIDPPNDKSAFITDIHASGTSYINILKQLNSVQGCKFLNSPNAIAETLDKALCKKKLMDNKIPCTEMLTSDVQSIEQLKEMMIKKNVFSVFIKPTFGSGAAGIMAYRFQQKTGGEALYTSSSFIGGVLCNTKKVRLITEPSEVQSVLGEILKKPVIVEKWIPKDMYNGYGYDIRVVYQFGKIEFMVARISKSPITNLHLNNGAIDIEEIGLTESCIVNIEQLCKNACSLFEGLNCAGIDVLISKHNKKPSIIEINGQGDLIYKDIYAENRIYKNQIKGMINL